MVQGFSIFNRLNADFPTVGNNDEVFPSLSDFSGWIYYKYFELGCFGVCWMLPEQLALLLREQINSIFNVLEEYQVTQVIMRETTIYSSHNPLVGGKHQLSTT